MRVISLLGLAVLSTVSGPVLADVPPTVTAETTAEAKALFERGASAYRAGEYERAIALFRQADRLAPRAALSFNMARAHERLGQRALAAAVYREYLRREPDADNASWVRQRIEELEPPPSEPKRGPASTPDPKPLPPALVASTERPRDDAPPPPDASSSSSSPLPWIAVGTGGALLVAAGALELARRDAESDARNASTQIEYGENLSEMRARATAARICAGVGGALLVTGGVILAVRLGQSSSSVSASASCSSAGCTGTLGGRF